VKVTTRVLPVPVKKFLNESSSTYGRFSEPEFISIISGGNVIEAWTCVNVNEERTFSHTWTEQVCGLHDRCAKGGPKPVSQPWFQRNVNGSPESFRGVMKNRQCFGMMKEI